ncbi:hypothetical protein L5515_015455 [Caenorhabditis briggsae]|uniref:Uncharacterized protein n=1 Tax=Caenorhabditis briggsae TaxID=6238 RepID=A0AAE9EHD2_CAEBR|nr:hypothetical protein L5515_015455 [Caenorhabditis briggsae]
MEQHIVMENDMVIAGEVVIGADEEVNELHLQLREKNQEIANLKDENEQLTVEKNTEENWKNYWFGAFNREKNRADGLQLEKDQAGFGTIMSNPQALQMDSEDVEFVEDNQAQPDAQAEAQPIFNNDLQGPVLTPMLYAAMVQPFMAKIVEQQKTIEELEEKNRDLLLQQPLNFWKRVEEAAILQEPVGSPPTAVPVKPTSFEEGVQLWRTNGFRNIKIPNIDMSRLLFSPTKGILQQCVTKVSNGIMLYNMGLRSLWRQPELNLRTLEHWDKLPKETQNEWCGKGLILAKWQNIQVDLGLILVENLRDGKLPY